MTSPDDKRTITTRPAGDGYVSVSLSWEDQPRKQPIAEWTLENFARGWKAELVEEGAW